MKGCITDDWGRFGLVVRLKRLNACPVSQT